MGYLWEIRRLFGRVLHRPGIGPKIVLDFFQHLEQHRYPEAVKTVQKYEEPMMELYGELGYRACFRASMEKIRFLGETSKVLPHRLEMPFRTNGFLAAPFLALFALRRSAPGSARQFVVPYQPATTTFVSSGIGNDGMFVVRTFSTEFRRALMYVVTATSGPRREATDSDIVPMSKTGKDWKGEENENCSPGVTLPPKTSPV